MVVTHHTVIASPAVRGFRLPLDVAGRAVAVEIERGLFKDLCCRLIVSLWTKNGLFVRIEGELRIVDIKIRIHMHISLFCFGRWLDARVTALNNPH